MACAHKKARHLGVRENPLSSKYRGFGVIQNAAVRVMAFGPV